MKLDTKSYSSFEIKALDNDTTGKFVAYGSVFGVVDYANDITVKGCFQNSIMEHKMSGKMPRFCQQHEHGKNPLGIITDMFEDEKGLRFEGQFCLETQAGREAYALCKMGALDEFSIGYITIKSAYNDAGNRLLQEVDLLEISLVTFACNPESTLVSIKSAPTTRDIQHAIRESFGLSKRQSEAAIVAIKSIAAKNEGIEMKMNDKPEIGMMDHLTELGIKSQDSFMVTETKSIELGDMTFEDVKSKIQCGLVKHIYHWDFYVFAIHETWGLVEFYDYVESNWKQARFDFTLKPSDFEVEVTNFELGSIDYNGGYKFTPDVVVTVDVEQPDGSVVEVDVEVEVKDSSKDASIGEEVDWETKSLDEIAEMYIKSLHVPVEQPTVETKSEQIDLESLDLSQLFK